MAHSHRPALTQDALVARMQARLLRLAALSTAPRRRTRARWDRGQFVMESVVVDPRV